MTFETEMQESRL